MATAWRKITTAGQAMMMPMRKGLTAGHRRSGGRRLKGRLGHHSVE